MPSLLALPQALDELASRAGAYSFPAPGLVLVAPPQASVDLHCGDCGSGAPGRPPCRAAADGSGSWTMLPAHLPGRHMVSGSSPADAVMGQCRSPPVLM